MLKGGPFWCNHGVRDRVVSTGFALLNIFFEEFIQMIQ